MGKKEAGHEFEEVDIYCNNLRVHVYALKDKLILECEGKLRIKVPQILCSYS